MSMHFSALVVNATTGDRSSSPCRRRITNEGSDKEEWALLFWDDKIVLTAKVYPRINAPIEMGAVLPLTPSILFLLI